MSDKTILLLGGGILAYMLLTRQARTPVPVVADRPTLHDQQDYWLKMAGISLAGQGIQALAKGVMSYNMTGGAGSTADLIDAGGYDGWSWGEDLGYSTGDWM